MIAKNHSFFKGILFLWFVSNSLFSWARIQSVELIYDQKEVYDGNLIRITLQVTDHKGRVHNSQFANSNYNFSDFEVTTSKNVKIIDRSPEYFSVNINSDTSSTFGITLRLDYGSRNYYRFTVQKMNYEEQVEALFIRTAKPFIQNRSEVGYILIARLKDGSQVQVEKNGKLKPEMFYQTLHTGGTLNNDDQTIAVFSPLLCNPLLFMSASLKSNPDINTELTLPIVNPKHTRIDFSGDSYQTENAANSGNHGGSPSFFQGDNGFQGSDGKSGNTGSTGQDGLSLQVYLSWHRPVCREDSLIAVVIKNDSNVTLETVYLTPNVETLTVQSNGGSGADGQNGGDGGDGGSGRYYFFEGIREISVASDGGNGGNGGNGGDGGDGGNGGNIVVYYPAELAPYLDQLILSTNPGKGGRGGLGGNPGKGGNKGNGGSENGNLGQAGNYGRNGRSGRSGFSGNVAFIETGT